MSWAGPRLALRSQAELKAGLSQTTTPEGLEQNLSQIPISITKSNTDVPETHPINQALERASCA